MRIEVAKDLGALLRALQPAAVLGLVPTSMRVEQQRDGFVVQMEFAPGEEAALRLFCSRLESTAAVAGVMRWTAN